MVTMLEGVLEVDHDRGVIYFHLSDKEQVKSRMVVTALRICSLPKPIPEIKQRMLDITHMFGCDWGVKPDGIRTPRANVKVKMENGKATVVTL